MDRLIPTGMMNRLVEFFEKTPSKSSSGEATYTNTSLGKFWAYREDSAGSQDEGDGQLVGQAVASFTIWANAQILAKASDLIIQDTDGEYQAASPAQFVDSKGRQIKIKAIKSGN